MALSLKPATDEDISLIGSMADTIWHEHYPSVITEEQIAYMLGKMYKPESLYRQMHEEGCTFYMVMDGEQPAGFISVSETGKGHYFLHKFYLLQRGKGTGSEAFKALTEMLNPFSIRLTVNRQNYTSVNFYFKNGFTIKEVADFDIGNGFVMNDFVMEWKNNLPM